jgi:predicted TIM-barrel fold metal-dependent hydrolase
VVELAGGYLAWWEAARACLGRLSPDEQAGIFGDNAARAYGI